MLVGSYVCLAFREEQWCRSRRSWQAGLSCSLLPRDAVLLLSKGAPLALEATSNEEEILRGLHGRSKRIAAASDTQRDMERSK